MNAKKSLVAGIAIGIGTFGLLACMEAPTPTPTPTPQPAPTSAPAPVAQPTQDDAVYTPSTNDCGPDMYRIEPGTCEWIVPPTPTPTEPEPEPEIGGAMLLSLCETEESTFCYGETGGQRYVITDGTMTFYLP